MTPLSTSAARRGLALALTFTGLMAIGCDSDTDPAASADATDGADLTDGTDAGDATDGTDAGDATDTTDTTDGTDGTDSGDASDGTDTTDGTDGTDGLDDTDVSDGTDGTDGMIFCETGETPDLDSFDLPHAGLQNVYCVDQTGPYAVLPDGQVLEVLAEDVEDGVRMWTRSRDLTDNTTTPVGETVVDGSLADFSLFPGGFLAVTPEADTYLFGYTSAGEGFPGAVIAGAGEATAAIDAPGNFDVAVVDDTTALVTALGVAGANEGNGLYLLELAGEAPLGTLLVTGLGSASGAVAVQGDLVLVGGFAGFGTTWPDGSEGNRVFAFDLADLLAAAGPVDAWTMGQVLDIPSDFSFLGENILLTREIDESWTTASLTVHHILMGDKGRAFITGSAVLSQGSAFDHAEAMPSGNLLLRGTFGYAVAVPNLGFAQPECATPCPEYATCLGGDTCAVVCPEAVVDPTSLQDALGPKTTLLVDFCGEYSGFAAVAAWDENTALGVSAEAAGGDTTLVLNRLELISGQATVAASHGVVGVAAESVYPGGYVALDATGAVAWFGYTAAGAGFPGEVLSADPAGSDEAAGAVNAPGNFAVAPISATEALVNGLGVDDVDGGQGIYLTTTTGGATLVATNLGSGSGGVAVFGDLVLVGGFAGFGTTWPDGSEGNRVFALSLNQLVAVAALPGIPPVDVFGTAQELGIQQDFQFLPDGRILTVDIDESWTVTGITAHTWAWDEDTLVIVGSRPVTTGATFTDASPVPGTDQLLLRHSSGLTLVAD